MEVEKYPREEVALEFLDKKPFEIYALGDPQNLTGES